MKNISPRFIDIISFFYGLIITMFLYNGYISLSTRGQEPAVGVDSKDTFFYSNYMKQQKNGSDLVTKDFLEKKLTELEVKFDKRFEQTDEKARQYHDDVLNKLDDVIKELETTREDRELAVYQTREMRDQIEDHEKRIRKVEKTQAA